MGPFKNFPFDKCAADAFVLHHEKGWTVYQKFTCDKCGSRQTMDVPNKFFMLGTCEECGHITDIKLRGCNYTAMKGIN